MSASKETVEARLLQIAGGREVVVDTYFKHPGGYVSGVALPLDEDGVVRNKYFVNCAFHPACSNVRFENCVFESCEGQDFLSRL